MSVNLGSAVGFLDLDTTKFKKGFVSALADMNKFKKVGEDGTTGLDKFNKKLDLVGAGFASVGKSLTIGLTAPIIGLGVLATKSAVTFQTSFAKVKTIADQTVVPFQKLQDGIIKLSSKVAISSSELNEALYQTISATGDTANALKYVELASKLAKGGFTTVTNAVDGATSVLNAYGLSGEKNFQKVSDIMITTQNIGKTTVDELAHSLAHVIPVAAAMGVQFDVVGAALAAITAQGTPTAQATTQLNQLFAELGKAGTEASMKLDMATESTEYAGKGFQQLIKEGVPLNKILELMKTFAEKNNLSLIDMFGSIEAGKTALQLTGEGGKIFEKALTGMGTAAGATDKAFKTMGETAEEKLKRMKVSIENTATKFGFLMLPAIESVSKAIQKLSDWIGNLTEKQKQTIITIAKVVAVVGPILFIFGKLASGIVSVIKVVQLLSGVFALFANPVGLIILGIAALVAIFVVLWNKCEWFRNFWIGLWEGIKNVFAGFIEFIKMQIDFWVKLFTEVIPGAFDWFLGLMKAQIDFWIKLFTETIPNAFKGFLTFIGNFITGIIDWFKELPYNIGYLIGTIAALFVNFLKMQVDFWVNFFTVIIPGIFTTFVNFLVTLFTVTIPNVFVSIVNFLINLWTVVIPNIFISFGKFILNFFTVTIPNAFFAFLKFLGTLVTKVGEFASKMFNAFVDTITKIPGRVKDLFASIPDRLAELGGTMKKAGEKIMNAMWDGLKSVWSGIGDWFTGVFSKIGDFFGGIVDGFKKTTKAVSSTKNGSHKDGLAYVPFDGYMAELHQGERVLTAEEARNQNNSGGGNTFIFNSPKAMDEYEARREFEKVIRKIDKDLL